VTCPGCPVIPGVVDRAVRWPSCELCRWPAVHLEGARHAWRCRVCGHANEHGHQRPREAVVRLRHRQLDPALLLAQVDGAQFGYPRVPRPGRRSPLAAAWSRSRVALGFTEEAGLRHREPPLYARAVVDRWPVLLVGGDAPAPLPLGCGDGVQTPERRSAASTATRTRCPCGEPAPCRHARALYLQVVAALLLDQHGRVHVRGRLIRRGEAVPLPR